MSKGLGAVQRAVLAAVQASPDGLAVDSIVERLYGEGSTTSQRESVRRAIRTLLKSGLVERSDQYETRARTSIKRFVNIAPCDKDFCPLCAKRKRRVRLSKWHREFMTASSQDDPAWLDDLELAEASGFVHETASRERLITEKPDAVDVCRVRVQIIFPRAAAAQTH